MLLVADIGNTTITLGLYDNEILVDNWKMTSDKNRSEDEYGILLRNILSYSGYAPKITGAIISSVV
ncbi:MAG: type III pantothenate kinase, partial [Candidatus Gastranaerophilales bacterium]|nr:type III pantothenate kinase [Candidatus Gastranaerophilales bacterium]